MNRKAILLRTITENPKATQRELAKKTGLSLGAVNSLIRECESEGYVELKGRNEGCRVTDKGMAFLENFKVDGALILAAGFGSRFVPLTYETPKGLVKVFGERMVERQIKQLNEAGITDITIAVGYMKEKFEYLRDKYGAKLLYNPEYAEKNTLSTIYHARSVLYGRNCYILSSDNWLRENLYHRYEGGAWYSAAHTEGDTKEWVLEFNKKGRITDVMVGGRNAWYMYGPAYFSREFSDKFLPVLERYYEIPGTEQDYWENVFMDMLTGYAKKRLTAYFGHIREADGCSDIEMYINPQPDGTVYEFENLEELREFDSKYKDDSGSEAMRVVSSVFNVPESEIVKIRCLKAGMTNNSWLFSIGGKEYICRIPGEGTDKLVNRYEEEAVYKAIKDTGITEELIYFNAENGYKISRYYEEARNPSIHDKADMECCMEKLRELHSSGIILKHDFNIRKKMELYVSLCEEADKNAGKSGYSSIPFEDFSSVYRNEKRLCSFLDSLSRKKTICHVDANPDNFIFLKGSDISDTERNIDKLKLIDWEYCGMCDPVIDIAMFVIYSYMNEAQAEDLFRMYLRREPDKEEKAVFYAYISLGGFLWALWAVYKEILGVKFGDYTLKMYEYAKKYYKKAVDLYGNISKL